MNAKVYKRLPGRRIAWTSFGRRSLWLGPDHLLSIANRGYSEEYKRFYYRDIQAFILTHSSGRLFGNLVMGGIAVFFVVLDVVGYFVWRLPEWLLIAWAIFAGLWIVLILINTLRGDTCVTVIRTAVHAERLPSLNRFRTAQRVMERIRPLIEQEQGRIEAAADISDERHLVDTSSRSLPSAALSQTQLRQYTGSSHLFLFLLLLLFSLASFATIFYSGMASYLLLSILYLLVVVTLIAALMRQNKTDLHKPVKGIAWSAFGFLWVFTVAGYGYAMFLMVGSAVGGIMDNLLRIFSDMSPMESTPLLFMHIVAAVFCFGLAVSGLIFLRQFQSHRDKQPKGEVAA